MNKKGSNPPPPDIQKKPPAPPGPPKVGGTINKKIYSRTDVLATIEEVALKTPLCTEGLQEGCRLMGDLSGMGLDVIAYLKRAKDLVGKKGLNE